MRIRELEVENFGVFRNRQFRFEPGLQIVFGQNETGKTTLLELVRQLLFGFPHRNAYAIHDNAGPLCAKAALEMADGQRVWFRRRKGRPDRVAGEIEVNRRVTEIDQRWLTAALGKATGELYKNVFGFSLQELAEGTESLRQANLTEALYGGGIGNIANVQRVRTNLAAETKRLYNTRSAKSEIRRLLKQIEGDQEDWRSAQVSPAKHREMLADQINADQAVDELKRRLKDHRQQANQRQCLLDAIEIHRRWRDATDQLGKLPNANIDESAPKRFEWLRAQSAQHAKAIAALEANIRDCDASITSLPPDGAYSAESDAIQKLHQQVARLRSYREDQPRRSQESESIREAVLAQLQQIHPDWTDDSLQRLQVGAEQRNTVRSLSEARGRFDRQRTKVKSLIKELHRQAKRWRTIADAPSEDASHLETASRLAEELTKHQVHAAQLNENVLAELVQAEQRLAACSESLARVRKWKNAPLPCHPPTTGVLNRAKTAFADQAKQANELEQQLARSKTRLGEAEADLRHMNEKADAPSAKSLDEARRRRDDGWQLLQQMVESPTEANRERWQAWCGDPPPNSPWEAVRDAIDGADRAADILLNSANIVALRKELDRDIQLAKADLDNGATRREALAEQRAENEREWSEAWTPCAITPLDPEEMIAWARDYRDWCELNDAVLRLRSRRDSLLAQVDSYQSQWANLLDAVAVPYGSDPAAEPSSIGIDWWNKQAETIQQREVARQELPDIESRLEAATQSLQETESQLETWAESWAKLLGELDFPPHWEPQLVQRVFQSLGEAAGRLRTSASLSKRASDMQEQLDKAEVEVGAVIDRLGVAVSTMPVDARISHLYGALDDERNGQQKKRLLVAQRDDAARRIEQRQQEMQQTADEIQELQARLNVTDEAEMADRLKTVKLRAEVQRSADQASEQLAALAAKAQAANADEFRGQLDQADEAQLNEAANRDALRTKELDDAIDQAQRKAGAASAAIERLVESTEATQRARKLASDNAQLAQLVDRWAPMAFASRLLEMSMKRFEREHQPALLRETAQLLMQLTNGRYQDVVRRIDEKQALVVKTESGEFRTPAELSTGAREQLYLAIRLAYVQQYCQRSEPLPMVMDDILVNFDDDRAASALEALHDFSEGKQILFLTCHERTIDLAKPLGIPIIELQGRGSKPAPPAPIRVSTAAPAKLEQTETDVTEQRSVDEPAPDAWPAKAVEPTANQANDDGAKGDIQRNLFPRE